MSRVWTSAQVLLPSLFMALLVAKVVEQGLSLPVGTEVVCAAVVLAIVVAGFYCSLIPESPSRLARLVFGFLGAVALLHVLTVLARWELLVTDRDRVVTTAGAFGLLWGATRHLNTGRKSLLEPKAPSSRTASPTGFQMAVLLLLTGVALVVCTLVLYSWLLAEDRLTGTYEAPGLLAVALVVWAFSVTAWKALEPQGGSSVAGLTAAGIAATLGLGLSVTSLPATGPVDLGFSLDLLRRVPCGLVDVLDGNSSWTKGREPTRPGVANGEEGDALSIRIPCQHCGERPIEEFVYGEVPVVPDSITDPAARDLDRAFMRDNVEGRVVERWFHVQGCRRWVTVTRDTRDETVTPGATT